jgi:hypothetical protein
VPTPPELGDGSRLVGRVEVLDQHEAEHQRQAHGHVRIAGKIEVDLKGVTNQPEPSVVKVFGAPCKRRVRDVSHRVGEQDFFGHAERQKRDATREFFERVLTHAHLLLERGVANDRARDQIWKKRLEAHVVGEAPHRPRVTAIHVDRVAHRLERVERDADWQHDVQHRHDLLRSAKQSSQRVDVLADEAGVLEHRQQPQVGDDRRGQHQLHLARPRYLRADHRWQPVFVRQL